MNEKVSKDDGCSKAEAEAFAEFNEVITRAAERLGRAVIAFGRPISDESNGFITMQNCNTAVGFPQDFAAAICDHETMSRCVKQEQMRRFIEGLKAVVESSEATKH